MRSNRIITETECLEKWVEFNSKLMNPVEEQKNQWVAPLLISIGSVGAASAVIVVFWKVIKPRYTIVRRT